MPAPPDDARTGQATITRLEACGDDAVLLACRPDWPVGPVRPSRFFMFQAEGGPLIPRPFSIYDQVGEELVFLIKVMGRGTRVLAGLGAGDRVRLTGPLGNGWPALDGDGPPWVMVAGGVGSAPFLLAIREAQAGMDGCTPCRPDQLHFLFGAANAGMLYDLDAFRAAGATVHSATDDGSAGFSGNAVQLLLELWETGALPREVRLLTCGPEPMMAAVERVARERDLECWMSLETLMGCGVGICNGCPVETRPDGPLGDWPNAKCCVEGPVFSSAAIVL